MLAPALTRRFVALVATVALVVVAFLACTTAARAADPVVTPKAHAASKGVVTTYRLHKVRSKAAKIRSARLKTKSGKRKARLSVRKVRRAARKGKIKVRVPHKLLVPGRSSGTFTPQPAPAAAPVAPPLLVGVGGKVVEIKPEPLPTQSPAPAPKPAPGACSFGTFSGTNTPGACWRPYSDDSPFNKPLPSGAKVHPNSSGIVQRVLGFGPITHMLGNTANRENDYGDPIYWSKPTDPEYTIHCAEDWGKCSIEGHKIRIPAEAKPAGASDGHMTVNDQESGWEYDFWAVRGKANGVITIGWGGRTRLDGDGLRSDATAAQFGNMAGKIRVEELEAGQINHALFIAMGCDNGTFVYPATKVGLHCADAGKSDVNAPAMGTRFMLDMSAAQIEALNVPAWKKTILRALAQYGGFMGDTGGGFSLAAESPMSQTQFGREDPWVRFAKANGVPYYAPDDVWIFNIRDGVDWARHLKVVDPCVTQGTC